MMKSTTTTKKTPLFKFKPFSKKQRQVLNWWCDGSPVREHDGIIADGAIRSGKSIAMSLSFAIWAMTSFENCNFGMCGKTIGSFRRNVLFWLKLMLRSRGYAVDDHRADNLLVVTRGNVQNYFYIFGGKDERSQDLIQGITLAGVFFDEVTLMPESFVNQAVARCSVEGSKYWFNCNPDNPRHWFHENWIDKREEKRLLYLHFTMDDNLSLTDKIKARYRSMYSGVFFMRFILGLWVPAEGVIYNQFAEDPERFILDEEPDDIIYCQLGMDFGGNGSASTILCTGFSRGLKKVVVLDEYYRKETITPTELENDAIDFIRRCQSRHRTTDMYCDSAEQLLIKGLKVAAAREHIAINIHNSRKYEIIDRIRFTNSIMSQERFYVMRRCSHMIDALRTAVWDSKTKRDVRLDDGTTDIDTLDGYEYSVESKIREIMDRRIAL